MIKARCKGGDRQAMAEKEPYQVGLALSLMARLNRIAEEVTQATQSSDFSAC
jgi:hypothetical protein